MAAVLARGTSVLDNAAREPEIVDLCRMLVAMGARIDGIGSSTLDDRRGGPADAGRARDRGGPDRRRHLGVRCRRSPAATSPSRAAWPRHLDLVLDKLGDAGAEVAVTGSGFAVAVDRRLRSFDVVTLPYPGFPTDLQPFAMALASVSDGTAMITENVFESRFMFAQELARLGADLHTDGHHAVVRGVPMLCRARRWSPTTSGPARRWCWPGSRPRESPPWRSPSTSTAATRFSRRCWPVSVQTSSVRSVETPRIRAMTPKRARRPPEGRHPWRTPGSSQPSRRDVTDRTHVRQCTSRTGR